MGLESSLAGLQYRVFSCKSKIAELLISIEQQNTIFGHHCNHDDHSHEGGNVEDGLS